MRIAAVLVPTRIASRFVEQLTDLYRLLVPVCRSVRSPGWWGSLPLDRKSILLNRGYPPGKTGILRSAGSRPVKASLYKAESIMSQSSERWLVAWRRYAIS